MPNRSLKKYLYDRSAAAGIPISGTFELTPRCNFNCRMCYIRRSPGDDEARRKELSAAEWLRIAEEAVKCGMSCLLLTGGEPLLLPDFDELYEALFGMGMLISVNTNASLLTEKTLELFSRKPPERINVTVYGASDETCRRLCRTERGFTRVRESLLRLKEAGVRTAVNTTFTGENAADMAGIVRLAQELGMPVRMSSFLFPPVRGGEPDPAFPTAVQLGEWTAAFERMTLDAPRRRARRELLLACGRGEGKNTMAESRISRCMAGRGTFWITWDGKMLPCGMLCGNGEEIAGRDFRECWEAVRETMKSVRLPEECLTCRWQPVCPNCAAVSYSTTGHTDALEKSMCERTETYVRTFLALTEKDPDAPAGAAESAEEPDDTDVFCEE